MASLPAPAPAPAKHDVFLSFRGEDTRDNFSSRLYAALCRKKIKTFIDNEVNREEVTSVVLLKEIEESKVSVVIFSKDYVDSPRCLDELVKILECKRTRGHEIIPVFYSISAVEIHDLVERFDDASVKKNSPNQDRDSVKKWKDALAEAANLSGWDFETMKLESDITYGIVENILKKLNHSSSSNAERIFGIESHIEELGKKLSNTSSGVQIVGIWGMGGIGKTTIAEAIFNKICSQFEGCCFLANVREEAQNRGLVRLRNELLSKILKKENLYVGAPMIGNNFLKRRLQCKKVLIVLDDVDDAKQLFYLVGERKWFNSGSRIIITTRDKHLLKDGADETYEVKGLAYKDALLLFCWNAFRQDHPTEDRKEISKMFLKYANGVPLALKVLGSFLHNRSREDWESALSKLEGTPKINILTVLRVSYDGLEDEEKDIFLDIACFFRRKMRDYVTKILDGYGFSADIGISVLIDKSLISISNDKIIMHDLLQEMGLEIVRQESVEEPGKRSRLLQHEDVHHVLTKKTGTEAVEGILLDMSKIREVNLSSDAFAKLHRLRFLRFYSSRYLGSSKIDEDFMFRELYGSRYYGSYKGGSMQLSQGLESLSNQLRFLQWHKFPLRSLPSSFCPRNLVDLNLPHSRVEHLWNGVQDLVNLKQIDLSYSQNLIEAPDLSQALNLEKLDLRGCTSLIEVPSSIQYLDKLDILELGNCKNLRSFPSNIHLRSLRRLSVSRCSNLKIFPEISWNVEELYIDGTAIEEVPSSIRNFSRLVTLNMGKCSRIESLPDSICELKSLRNIYLGRSAIKELPLSIENMSGLTVLYLTECKNLVSLPDGICNLKSLCHLALFGCSKLDKLPADIGNLKRLVELEVHETAIVRLPDSIAHLNGLVELSFSGCKGQDVANFPLPPLSGLSSLRNLVLRDCGLIEFPAAVTCLTTLENLNLAGNSFKIIPASIKLLVDLQRLDLTDCKRLQIIPELPPDLKYFSANGCTSLETISSTKAVFPQWLDSLSRHMFLYTNCSSLDRNSRTNIMEDSKQKIQVLATACHKLFWGFHPTPSVTVSFPGSEIPEWFGYQNIGTSVTIRLPPRRRGFPKFLGFVFSVVVAFKEDYNNDSDFTLRCESDYEDLYCNFDGGQRFDKLELDHLFLLFDHCLYLMANKGEQEGENEASFRFFPVDKNKQPLLSCTVKKCGVHLLFAPEGHDALTRKRKWTLENTVSQS